MFVSLVIQTKVETKRVFYGTTVDTSVVGDM